MRPLRFRNWPQLIASFSVDNRYSVKVCEHILQELFNRHRGGDGAQRELQLGVNGRVIVVTVFFLPICSSFLVFLPVKIFVLRRICQPHSRYLAIVAADGAGVASDTTPISTHEMIVIGTTGIRPAQASAPGTRAV
jgi:hypothetical protein